MSTPDPGAMMRRLKADVSLRNALFMVIVEYGRDTGHGTDDTFVTVERVLSLVREFYVADDA